MTDLPLTPSRTKPSLTARILPDGKPIELIGIETVRETHDGPLPGRHARYVLRSEIAA